MKIVTVCGNGIGSSLMCAMRVEQLCEEENIKATVESCDFNSVEGKGADLIITIDELGKQFTKQNVATIRSYTNKKKIKEDVLEKIKTTFATLNK